MAAYNGQSRRVKDALKTVLKQIEYDTGAGPEMAFTDVLGSTADEFKSYPCARVLPGTLQSDKWSTKQDKRVLPFVISVYLRLDTASEEDVYDHMYDLTDLVFDQLGDTDETGALNVVDPTIGTYVLRASRGEFLVTVANNGSVLYCDLNVEVEYTKDFY